MLGCGKRNEGLAQLDRALAQVVLSDTTALATEVWFYALSAPPGGATGGGACALKEILLAGGRSPGWNLVPHLQRADLAWLEKVAAVITKSADIATLAGWEAWDASSERKQV